MLTTSENIRKNRSHYDELYGHVSTDRIVAKIRNLPAFLTDAIATDTTWHGL